MPAAELGAGEQRLLVGLVAALHVLALWAVLQVPAVRQAVRESVPLFVDILAPEAPPAAPKPPPPPRLPATVTPPRAPPLITSSAPPPSPAATFVAEPPPIEPAPAAQAPVVEAAPPPPPRVIPSSGVQYLTPPPLEYPRASRRLGEAGKVLVRVYIDDEGLPRNVQVAQSSGHVRLDEAAIAAVHKARFKPYTENGRAVAGWAFIPLSFDLEK